MDIAAISDLCAGQQLDVFGVVNGDNDTSIVLLGPKEPGFWGHFQSSPEAQDGKKDSLDRWSAGVISHLAAECGARALLPFGGPPYQPFIRWAMESGRAWQSPAGPLVHDTAGMMVSYRGALEFPDRISTPTPPVCPCTVCTDKPCLTACPVNALSAETGYDLTACHSHLDTPQGQDCMTMGCAARRACPVSARYGRLPEQSAFHMKAFHP